MIVHLYSLKFIFLLQLDVINCQRYFQYFLLSFTWYFQNILICYHRSLFQIIVKMIQYFISVHNKLQSQNYQNLSLVQCPTNHPSLQLENQIPPELMTLHCTQMLTQIYFTTCITFLIVCQHQLFFLLMFKHQQEHNILVGLHAKIKYVVDLKLVELKNSVLFFMVQHYKCSYISLYFYNYFKHQYFKTLNF